MEFIVNKALSSLILLSSYLFLTSAVSAGAVDEYGRTLLNHELQGGHTIRKHVAKTNAWLRNRCRTDRAVKRSYATTYETRTHAEEIIADMIKDERSKVNSFIRGSKKTERINVAQSLWERQWGVYGQGIDCRKVGRTRLISFRFYGKRISFRLPIDMVGTRYARAILKKSPRATGGWHILTSFPTPAP